ncbi:hypothetical protein [Streptomyces sp. NPDC088760]|uniref:hypothetical protein n=1 Tax=Streptomyces sp. NPDC088760 TaxID=3365890 RepID=UPI00380FE873
MRAARADVAPFSFGIEYHSLRQDGYVAVTVRSPLTLQPRCPEPVEKDATCRVDGHGERTVELEELMREGVLDR